MRTLFISNTAPYPLNSGCNQRVYHLMSALARVSELTLVCPAPGGKQPSELSALRSLYKECFLFPSESIIWRQEASQPRPLSWVKNALRSLHPTQTVRMQLVNSAEGAALVGRLCSQGFDLIWAEGLASLSLLPPRIERRVVVDLHDLEYRKLAYRLRNAYCYPWMPFDVLEFVKLRRLEHTLTRLPYEFAVCSEVDKQYLGGGPRVWVVPNGVDLPSANLISLPYPDRPVFLFVGTMDYEPNVNAVRFFAHHILPSIRRAVPDARFFIVGRDPSPAVKKLHDGESIIVTGTVPEVQAHLREATVVVVPIRFGGGTRIKILEAMAHRRPVISTRVGAEGIGAKAGTHLLLADDPSAFVEACLLVLKDAKLRESLIDAAYHFVNKNYEWSHIETHVQAIALANPFTSHFPTDERLDGSQAALARDLGDYSGVRAAPPALRRGERSRSTRVV